MKALISNRFDIADLTFNLTTALYARKRKNVWRVHLNYHQITVKYLQSNDNTIKLLSGSGITLQTSRDNDWISGVALILGSMGIIGEVIRILRSVMDILADVSSLIPKVLEWIQNEITKRLNNQEPAYQSLSNTQFVLQLMRDGTSIERRLPRWRRKTEEQVRT